MNAYPLISIITINYKQAQVTNQLLKSLQNVTWPNIEVIVVDNASGEEDFTMINTTYVNTKLICSKVNLGFAGGNNLGIKKSKGKYILLLNNDTEVDPGFIEPMIKWFLWNHDTGAISPKIKYYYQPNTIQYAGFTKMNPFTLRMKGIGYGESDNGQYEQLKETEFAHGCAMMLPRKVIDTVGLMPEEYFLYYEEHDWSNTLKKHGYKIYYHPQSIVYHKESVSVKKESITKTYFMNRNRILYMRRNFNWFYKIISVWFILFISIPRNILRYILTSKYNHLQAYIDAILWNVTLKTKAKWNL